MAMGHAYHDLIFLLVAVAAARKCAGGHRARGPSRQVGAAVELLKQHGPSLKRPLVGEITTSRIKNMKELRRIDRSK